MCEPVSETSSVGRDRQARGRLEPGDRLGRVDPCLDGDADRIAGLVDPGQDLEGVGRQLVEAGPGVEFGCAAHHAASCPTTATTGARGGVASGPVEDPSRRHLDERPLEEERQGDACLEEVDDRRLLLLPDREEPLPAAVRVVLDHPGVALDRRAIEVAADRHRVGDRDRDLRVGPDVLELAAEQARRRQVDALAVPQRDERVGDGATVARR